MAGLDFAVLQAEVKREVIIAAGLHYNPGWRSAFLEYSEKRQSKHH